MRAMLKIFRDEGLGLLLIAASIVVILVVSALALRSQLESRRERNRDQGVSLARLLSSFPLEDAVARAGRQGPLEVLKASQTNPDFAWAAVVSLTGRTLAEATGPGVLLEPADVPPDPVDWISERVVRSHQGGRPIREFLSPLIEGGERVAHVRVGFFDPTWTLFLEQASFFGMLALPVFLLVPIAYFLLRREIRPFADAYAQLNERLESQRFDRVQIEATGEVGQFIRGFNRFMELAQTRIAKLEKERTGVVASSKVLAYQKARIEAALETFPDATLVLDETGSVVFANGKLEPILGVAPEKAVGHPPAEWCRSGEIVSLLARYQGSGVSRSDAIEVAEPEAGERTLAVSAHPLAAGDDASPFSGTLVVIRDVSSSAHERRAQGEFVSHVAHELKAPLNVVSMYGESLAGSEGDQEEFRLEASNVIRDEVERLATLVNTLLTIARIETGATVIERQRVRLRDFIEDAVATVSRSGRGADLRFALELPGDLAPIYVDKDLFRVALNNLLTNAIKYSDEGGEITVSAEERAGRVSIRVRDTGVGIAEPDLPHIFDKFYRSPDERVQKRSGHGLGLALAREIVQLHGGKIVVESAPGDGSEFTIVLKTRARPAGEEGSG